MFEQEIAEEAERKDGRNPGAPGFLPIIVLSVLLDRNSVPSASSCSIFGCGGKPRWAIRSIRGEKAGLVMLCFFIFVPLWYVNSAQHG